MDFNIVATDYNNYQILYSCTQGGFMKYEWFGLYSKTPTMSNQTMAAAKEAIATYMPQYDLDKE